jgi:hypothetical protein
VTPLRGIPPEFAGTDFAFPEGMLRFAARGILIGFALAACVTCIKARQAQSPMGLARDLQRHLSIVNLAAVRRRGTPHQSTRVPVRTVAAGRPTAKGGIETLTTYQVGRARAL